MNCPTCSSALIITERNGIEIDYCQKCRGVWLDRGELDKLIERAGSGFSAPSSGKFNDEDDEDEHRGHKGQGYGAHQRRERENPLMDIFDFF